MTNVDVWAIAALSLGLALVIVAVLAGIVALVMSSTINSYQDRHEAAALEESESFAERYMTELERQGWDHHARS